MLTMEPSEESQYDDTTITAGFNNDTFRLRSYQTEMVEASMRANIIVAMDTGSGKTHIALARTAAQLERCDNDQVVWFLAPTVTLCEQQFQVFKANLPAYSSVVLSGNDNVDYWTDQSIWDRVLKNVRIVLSTHQVLLDALTHGFVTMTKVALLIFDEAHHCVAKHPANQIMANFYRPLVQSRSITRLPQILGLSASPVMKARASNNDLQIIEENLNSTAKSPKIHRSELVRFVHRPKLLTINYAETPVEDQHVQLFSALQNLASDYDLKSDPYVVDLLRQQTDGHYSEKLKSVFLRRNTYCLKQLKSLVTRTTAMRNELGSSPTYWYIYHCISKYEQMNQNQYTQLLDSSAKDKQHLSNLFRTLPISTSDACLPIVNCISPKVQVLIEILLSEAGPGFTGLVFVEQRVWVAALAEILTTHPLTKDIFSVGTYVGTANSTKRKLNISDLLEPQNQQHTLDDFRAGRKNLILATSVLEEGIDISSCHLVICFEPPKNLKSFVQRRGRARKQESKYMIFIPESGKSPEIWESLEQEMKEAYLNDLREVRSAEERELQEEENKLSYRISSTGALLTSENSSQHLHHFCSLLGSGPYIDSRPQFMFKESENGLITAEVILPISVNPTVRVAQSERSWKTERMAKNDAAFQAYRALHVVGLVNDNILPGRQQDDDEALGFQNSDHTPSLVEVSPALDPWVAVAEMHQRNPQTYHRTFLKIKTGTEDAICMVLLTPRLMPEVPEFLLFWNRTTEFSVECCRMQDAVLDETELQTMRSITRTILHSIFHRKMEEDRYDFLYFLLPSSLQKPIWDHIALKQWDENSQGYTSASKFIEQRKPIPEWGMIKVLDDDWTYLLQQVSYDITKSILPCASSEQLGAIRSPKRRDFLHAVGENIQQNEAYTRIEWLNATNCIVSNMPASYSIAARLAPSILRKYEIYMIADTLRTTILEPLGLDPSHLGLLVRAITSSATGEEDNYQRVEFLGDCILKFISSVHLMAAHPISPESWLTGKKGKVVSNGFLARAALSAELDKFIITKRFTGSKWAPRYATDLPNPVELNTSPLLKSSKLLADVVESLIGTSYVIGGIERAFICIQTLLPLEVWTTITRANQILFNDTMDNYKPPNLEILESLVGYTFIKKSLLLEALTHASYNYSSLNMSIKSYERLEFLGDAVLDYIISTRLYNHTPDLTHQQMHAVRTALANAAFLTFRMLETTIAVGRTDKTTLEEKSEHRALWQFLRHTNQQLIEARNAALIQHAASRDQILLALRTRARFPWDLLSRNDAPKFLSDIVESVIGAIYVDSHGSIESCEIFVRKLGIFDCLERILRDGVDCLHPKERLGHLAHEKDVQYHRLATSEDKGVRPERTYRVQIKIGGQNVGESVEGMKRLNAETIAAWRAVRIIEGVDDAGMVDDHVNDCESQDEWHDAEEHAEHEKLM